MAGLLGGFGAGLEYFAKAQQADQDREEDFAITQRKLELANKLEMDLLRQKQAFAQQFPQYEHFEKMPNGVIAGIDRMGNSKDVYTPSQENMDLAKKAYDITQLLKQNQAAVTGVRANTESLLAPIRANLYGKQAYAAGINADANKVRADAVAERAAAVSKPKPLDPITLQLRAQYLAKAMAANDPEAQLPKDFDIADLQNDLDQATNGKTPQARAQAAASAAATQKALDKRKAYVQQAMSQLQADPNSGGGIIAPANQFQDMVPQQDSDDPTAGY